MADYCCAFRHVFGEQSKVNIDIRNIDTDNLSCWQSMKKLGFSMTEIYTLFRQLYGVEIWQDLKADSIEDQFSADLLFKAAVQGYLSQLLKELQSYFDIPCSGKMCKQTLALINQLDGPEFKNWLYWGVSYLEMLESRKNLVAKTWH